MSSQVRREYLVGVREPFLGEAPITAAVRRDAVQADERGGIRRAPAMDVKPHQRAPARASMSGGRVSRQSPTTATSAVPVTGPPEVLSTRITLAFTEATRCSKSPSVSTAT